MDHVSSDWSLSGSTSEVFSCMDLAVCATVSSEMPASRLLRVASVRRLLLITAAALIKDSCASLEML